MICHFKTTIRDYLKQKLEQDYVGKTIEFKNSLSRVDRIYVDCESEYDLSIHISIEGDGFRFDYFDLNKELPEIVNENDPEVIASLEKQKRFFSGEK